MKRFERPISNPMLESQLRDLSPRVIEIAEDPLLQGRIHDFMLGAVDTPAFTADGHVFNYQRIAVMGKGTLLSVYDQSGCKTLPIYEDQVAITSSFGDEEIVIDPWYTLRVPKPYGDQSNELVLGVPDNFDDIDTDFPGMSEYERYAEELKQQVMLEREWQALPRVFWGGKELWRIERDGDCELLTDLRQMNDKVRLAISKGIGSAAFERFDPTIPLIKKPVEKLNAPVGYLDIPQPQEDTGQKQQKMVA